MSQFVILPPDGRPWAIAPLLLDLETEANPIDTTASIQPHRYNRVDTTAPINHADQPHRSIASIQPRRSIASIQPRQSTTPINPIDTTPSIQPRRYNHADQPHRYNRIDQSHRYNRVNNNRVNNNRVNNNRVNNNRVDQSRRSTVPINRADQPRSQTDGTIAPSDMYACPTYRSCRPDRSDLIAPSNHHADYPA